LSIHTRSPATNCAKFADESSVMSGELPYRSLAKSRPLARKLCSSLKNAPPAKPPLPPPPPAPPPLALMASNTSRCAWSESSS
jgi:hypothetical protein